MRTIPTLSFALFLALALGCRATPSNSIAAASAAGDSRALSTLATGTAVNAPDGNGWTPLVWATRNGHVTAIQTLARNGARLDQADTRNGWTPLIHAVHKNELQAAGALLGLGADPNRPSEGSTTTPLLMASAYGNEAMVQLLLESGADPRLASANGDTPLDAAVAGANDIDQFTMGQCQTGTVRLLLDKAPDLPLTSRSSLWVAKAGRCREVVKLVAGRVTRG